MEFQKKYWMYGTATFLVCLFLWLRFYNLNSSMFFINDMGRDLLVLFDWKTTGKPPLLGPQTSALPINQSAIYFYMLMPAFLLLKGSPMTLFYTNAFVYIFFFLLGLWLLREKTKLQLGLLALFFLVTITPQYLTQSRFIVWNPSFITPFLSIALISFYLLTEKFSKNLLLLFTVSLAMSISLSYSVAPVFISIFIYLLIFWKKNRFKTILSTLVGLTVINLPTLVFEVKHKFLLTTSLLSKGTMPQKADDISFVSKFNSLFGIGLGTAGFWLLASVLLLTAVIFWYSRKKENKELRLFSVLLALTVLITFIVPLTIHSHYIFGFTTLLFLCIATLPTRPKLIILAVMSLVYLNSALHSGLFSQASRTYDQMSLCFAKVCNEIKDPIFVSVQANFHPYHNGPEHRYLMKMAGCDVRYIEEPDQKANLMAVVLDDSNYIQGVTAYNELTLFGKAKEVKRFNCQSNFAVVILEKDLKLIVPKDK